MTVSTLHDAAYTMERSDPITEPAAEAWVPSTCFKTGPPARIGVELELHPHDMHDPALPLPPDRAAALWEALKSAGCDGRLSREPGGQVELSSPPASELPQLIDSVEADRTRMADAAAEVGVVLTGAGVDPWRPARRVLDHPRYVAMERYFRPWGSAGPTMMCLTASVQVNVEANGHERWRLLHAVGPVLLAAFANSPLREGRRTGAKSSRMAAWLTLDPARTAPPRPRPDESVEQAWTRYALDAPVLAVRRPGPDWSAPHGLTFRRWIAGADVPGRRAPSADDLAYHLTTLFPPVRPRGWLEVRYLDAQPGAGWTLPVAVIAALLADAAAGDAALASCEPVGPRWLDAARQGLDDRVLRASALRLLAAAAEALDRDPSTSWLAADVDAFSTQWTARGRCPADDPWFSLGWSASGARR